jgi:peptidoglycan/LPS O-acetylase OafA/YrhL
MSIDGSLDAVPASPKADDTPIDRPAEFQRAVRTHLPALDGLRGLAVAIVVWHNAALTGPGFGSGAVAGLLNLAANLGWMGVQLFFVLSGFLITGILLDEKGAPHQFRNFYMRRSLRIFPLYYAVLIFAFMILPALGSSPAWSIVDTSREIWYWTYLDNWVVSIEGGGGGLSHFWSLAVEEQFYLLWPFAVIMLRRRALFGMCLLLIASAPLARVLMIQYDFELAKSAAYEFTIARWDALGMGALLAMIVRHRPWLERTIASAPLVTCGVLGYMVLYIALNHNFAPVEHGIAAFNQSVAALMFAIVLFNGIFPAGDRLSRWQTLLQRPALRHIGKYSYAIYVFHFPIVVGFVPLWEKYFAKYHQLHPSLDTVGRVCAAGISSYLLSRCSWYFLEQPFLRLKKFFQSPVAARP